MWQSCCLFLNKSEASSAVSPTIQSASGLTVQIHSITNPHQKSHRCSECWKSSASSLTRERTDPNVSTPLAKLRDMMCACSAGISNYRCLPLPPAPKPTLPGVGKQEGNGPIDFRAIGQWIWLEIWNQQAKLPWYPYACCPYFPPMLGEL